jgi:DNA processing protein
VATLVTDAAEVVDMVGDLGADAVAERRGAPRPWDGLAPVTRDVLEAMPARRPATVDELCRTTGLAAGACIAALGELTLSGLVVAGAQGWSLPPRRRGA